MLAVKWTLLRDTWREFVGAGKKSCQGQKSVEETGARCRQKLRITKAIVNANAATVAETLWLNQYGEEKQAVGP